MLCRRCKKAFLQVKSETRCSECLQLRRNNRILVRRREEYETQSRESIRRMMISNGSKKGGHIRVVG